MRKTIRTGLMGLLFLFAFNISIIAASDYTPWKLHKDSAQEIVQTIRTYFHKQSIKPIEEWDGQREEQVAELEVLLDGEKSQIITEVRNYGKGLEAQLNNLLEKQSVLEVYATYETERNEQMHVEVEEEIAIFLDELLSKK
ncbi:MULTISPECIES: hypothetical protein [unclassified Oceanobacillus]|uniref:hypothetical protein n=1 Tax=unclassified Oceanobacillus TaxID=2630292 RepID=UPI00300E5E3A